MKLCKRDYKRKFLYITPKWDADGHTTTITNITIVGNILLILLLWVTVILLSILILHCAPTGEDIAPLILWYAKTLTPALTILRWLLSHQSR